MKKTLSILLILAMALSLCACGKTAVTGAEFCSRMQDLGMEVYPNPELVDGEDIKKAFVGGNDDLTVFFLEVSGEDLAKNAYLNGRDDAPSGSGSSTEINGVHSGFYSRKTKSEGFMVAYVDSTVMIGWSSADQYDALKTVFETMGYK